jgi:hypothetical protein
MFQNMIRRLLYAIPKHIMVKIITPRGPIAWRRFSDDQHGKHRYGHFGPIIVNASGPIYKLLIWLGGKIVSLRLSKTAQAMFKSLRPKAAYF